MHMLPGAPVSSFVHPGFGMANGMHVMFNQNPSLQTAMTSFLPPTHPNYKNPVVPMQLWQIDPMKAEEIARTVYIGNISLTVTEEQLRSFFSQHGAVSYLKMAGDSIHPSTFAFLEYEQASSANLSLTLNGHILGDRPL
ncbi:Protein srek1IP1, partial [Nowakowskiella sp. JEL0078]